MQHSSPIAQSRLLRLQDTAATPNEGQRGAERPCSWLLRLGRPAVHPDDPRGCRHVLKQMTTQGARRGRRQLMTRPKVSESAAGAACPSYRCRKLRAILTSSASSQLQTSREACCSYFSLQSGPTAMASYLRAQRATEGCVHVTSAARLSKDRLEPTSMMASQGSTMEP